MANIIGNNPEQWAADQVNLRQQLLGLRNQTPEMLVWQTSKTAWIRAISAVQVNSKIAEELSGRQNMGGGKLAQEYVLFNGTVGLEQQNDGDGNITYDQKTNAGVYSGPNPQTGTNSSAYGFEYESSRGLVPMPGIEDLSITTYNRGSLRKASFKIKAFNQKQFAILDALFMRPGYTLLLEWGHTTYFKGTPEKPTFATANFNTAPFLMMNNFLEDNEVGSQTQLLSAIKRERGNGESGDGTVPPKDTYKIKGSQGNYDGFYGKITNFVWSLNPDGSYNIEVKAISTGDIVESLTIDRVEASNSNPKKITPSSKRSSAKYVKSDKKFTLDLTDKRGNPYSKTFRNIWLAKQHKEYWRDVEGFKLDSNENFIMDALTDVQQARLRYWRKTYPSTMKNFKLKPPPNTLVPQEEGNDILLANKDKSKLNAFLYKKFIYLTQNFKNQKKEVLTTLSFKEKVSMFSTLGEIDEYGDLLMVQPTVMQDVVDHTGEKVSATRRAAKNSPYQYIILSRLLEFIEENLLIYNGGLNVIQEEALQKELDKLSTEKEKDELLDKRGLTGFNEKILNFDLDGNNYMYTQPTQFSADPSVCLIPFKFPTSKVISTKGTDGKETEKVEISNDFISYYGDVLKGCDFKMDESEYVANMLEIPVNLNYIGKVLKQVTSNNSVPLLKFLEQILFGINTALGSINKFSVTYDHDSNTVVFRDDVPLDPKVAKRTVTTDIEQRTLFNVNGFKPKQKNASFVTNVNMTTTLSNKFATMISIGAQSQKESDVANSTSLSKWNTGLSDSVTPSKLSKAGIESKKSKQRKPFDIFSKSIVSLNKPSALLNSFYRRSRMPDGDVQSTAQSLNANLNKYITTVENKNALFGNDIQKGAATKKKANPPSTQGFIPFSMNLDMDGFSGLRIYEKFYITTEILPPSYPKALSFICKGITHTINNSGWKTKIDSLTITSVDPEEDKKMTTPDNTYRADKLR